MIVRFKTVENAMSYERFMKCFANVVKDALESGMEELGLTISGATLYVGFHDEEGRPSEMLIGDDDEVEYYVTDFELVDKVKRMLEKGMKNKDIAKELNIRPQAVSIIKTKILKRQSEVCK